MLATDHHQGVWARRFSRTSSAPDSGPEVWFNGIEYGEVTPRSEKLSISYILGSDKDSQVQTIQQDSDGQRPRTRFLPKVRSFYSNGQLFHEQLFRRHYIPMREADHWICLNSLANVLGQKRSWVKAVARIASATIIRPWNPIRDGEKPTFLISYSFVRFLLTHLHEAQLLVAIRKFRFDVWTISTLRQELAALPNDPIDHPEFTTAPVTSRSPWWRDRFTFVKVRGYKIAVMLSRQRVNALHMLRAYGCMDTAMEQLFLNYGVEGPVVLPREVDWRLSGSYVTYEEALRLFGDFPLPETNIVRFIEICISEEAAMSP